VPQAEARSGNVLADILTADGTDYLAHGSGAEAEFAGGWPALQPVLEGAERKLTRPELRRASLGRPPDAAALYRLLEAAEARGLVCKDGLVRRGRHFRYWLPGKEDGWRNDRPRAAAHARAVRAPAAGRRRAVSQSALRASVPTSQLCAEALESRRGSEAPAIGTSIAEAAAHASHPASLTDKLIT
jgi:hypothetical protein